MSSRTAILIVNGYDQIGHLGTTFDASEAIGYPWIDICLREIRRRSEGADYEIFVWDNSRLLELRRSIAAHGAHLFPSDEELESGHLNPPTRRRSLSAVHAHSLDRLLAKVDDSFEFVLTLDTDAFPIRDRWLDVLHANLRSAELTGIWRDEMSTRLSPYVHPSCLCIRRERLLQIDDPFSLDGVQDAGQWITNHVLLSGGHILPLRRSNARNFHFLIGGVYGDLVYHHGAGSRRPLFRLTEGDVADNAAYTALRDAAFSDLDHLIAMLKGESPDDLGLAMPIPTPHDRTSVLGAEMQVQVPPGRSPE